MKRKRYIAWILMVASMMMLTASVLPHHHHREILCLQHDITACCCQCASHPHSEDAPGEGHTCHAGCVTKFNSVTPDKLQDNVSPDYSFCSLLYTITNIWVLSLRLNEHHTQSYTYYLEKFYSINLPYVKGLRAPPAGVLA